MKQPALFKSTREKSGFTLIELLITISIIAILSAVGLIVYSTAQKNGRISKRVQDLRAISAALEVYHTANGVYPNTQGGSGSWVRSQCVLGGTLTQDLVVKDVVTASNPLFVPAYMAAFPSDPSMNATYNNIGSSCYTYDSNGTDYKIAIIKADTGSGGEMTVSDFAKQPQLIDPKWSGSAAAAACGTPTTGGPTAWAIYTQGSGAPCF